MLFNLKISKVIKKQKPKDNLVYFVKFAKKKYK